MKQRTLKAASLVIILSLFTVLLAACGANSEKTAAPARANAAPNANISLPETLRIGFISANNNKTITGPEGWAQSKGYLESELKKYGVKEFKYFTFPNGPNLNEAISAGTLDVGIYGDTPAINGKAAGLKTRLINVTQVNMNAWLVAKADGSKSLDDLKGKKVATSQGSYMSRYLTSLLKEKGLDKDVKILHLLPADAEAALSRGDIAAYAYPTGFGPLLLKKGYVAIDEAANHPLLQGSSLTVVTEDYLAKNPQFPKLWNDLRTRAVKEIRENNEEYFKFYAEASGYPLDVVKASFKIDQWPVEAALPDGLKLIEETKKFLVDQGLAKKDYAIKDWLTD
ncbi:ABC transporter substrate-binding protein [Paenibacillus aceris]|uniref:ABC-type nitrate/sulfonate/bicarbonate transport system substrate-binding protein n=1 Tax=Paenibacillus aceris TaxID=869555 RepID=A0ABS4HSY3_9BACL|nr:ABC transporter substrate-binding protein [Paenibacillus aceris]MBP1961729.1 ABC-type nitrate/sulfonate/bicarbonate transport system substrate-binding protein [Paenibacillus aceris]NHW34414.1 ABC transporter substrate-binding protein [Paenibacillus aceris]